MKPASPLPWRKEATTAKGIDIKEARGAWVASIPVLGIVSELDAAYIVHAANLYPRMAALLKQFEQYNQAPTHWGECAYCGYSPVDGGHQPDCALDALLKEIGDNE